MRNPQLSNLKNGWITSWDSLQATVQPGNTRVAASRVSVVNSKIKFTHCIPGIIPPRAAIIESTLQIYSFKITGLSDDLKWPLNVYGVIAARDTMDHNRNLLFSRSSIMCQVLTYENDCSLRLTGPSRAILAKDPVDFEVELRVHDGCDPRGDGLNDRKLICASSRYEVATSSELPLACLGPLSGDSPRDYNDRGARSGISGVSRQAIPGFLSRSGTSRRIPALATMAARQGGPSAPAKSSIGIARRLALRGELLLG
ncbi:hypothetical protein ZWY2020_011502 [Hordeum vulgare]|nr:hypothetical protein ZWY2020_011502 [Hordeum vulgare]